MKSVHSKTKALRTAYEVLVKMQAAKLQPPDEVSACFVSDHHCLVFAMLHASNCNFPLYVLLQHLNFTGMLSSANAVVWIVPTTSVGCKGAV